jgi:hypothetical protein
MAAYFGKQRANSADNVSPTRGTVLKLIRKMEGVGDRLFMDNYFSSPQLFSYVYRKKINNFGPKIVKMKKGGPSV